jgi:uncharacterized protein YegL
MRKLPVYLVLDVSGSMQGEPIQAVQNGLQLLLSSLRQNPQALETAYLSVITFGPTAKQVTPLTELIDFQIPQLQAEGVGTALGAALQLLTQKIQTEVVQSNRHQKGDWKPIVFLMTDGEPTDDFEQAIRDFKKVSTGLVIACAAGADANTYILKAITENVVELATLDSKTAQSFFKWVSASIGVSSHRVNRGNEINQMEDLPPLPQDVKKVIDLRKGKKEGNNPFNTFDRQRALNKDKFGNAAGTEFDLAKDGAFLGQQVAVLHLYTGEGFDFRFPEQALKEKGFTVHRWQNYPPSPAELNQVLSKSCQLWVISDSIAKLTQAHIDIIKNFFNSGKGLYLWGDNVPWFVDANAIAQQLFRLSMAGDELGDKVLHKKTGILGGGFIDHPITTGLDFLYEGVTIATFPNHHPLTTLVYTSSNNPVTVLYEQHHRRAILDGGFTRLFVKWDSAGTARYVKNAAAWLVNYEYFNQNK